MTASIRQLRAAGAVPRPAQATRADRARANAYDSPWRAAWVAKAAGLYTTVGKVAGKVLLIGDSFTASAALRNWAAESPSGGNGQTAEDDAVLTWLHAREAWDNSGDGDSGFGNATLFAVPGVRTFTAKNGASAGNFLASAPAGSTTDQATARAWLASSSNSGIPIDVITAAFDDAQYAVVLFSGVPAGGAVVDLGTVCDRLEAAGILPILETLPHRYIPGDAAATTAYNRDYVDPYNANIRAMARARSLPLIDTFAEFSVRRPTVTGSPLLQVDGVHPSGATGGYTTTSSPYAAGGDAATHRTGAALDNVGYLLRAWLIVSKFAQVKALVADLAPSGPGVYTYAPLESGSAPWHPTIVPYSSTEMRVAWYANASGGVPAQEYVIERSADGTSGWAEVGRTETGLFGGGQTRVFADTGLTPGATWYYRVWRSQDYPSGGIGPSPVMMATLPVSGPWTPDGLDPVPRNTTAIDVTWLQVPDGTAYELQRSPAGAGEWATVYSGPALRCNDSGLAAATAYDYRVRSFVGTGPSYWSPARTASTHATGSGRRLLRPGDFTYLGSFLPPFWLNSPTNTINTAFAKGIAVRRVGGVTRLFGLAGFTASGSANAQQLFEFTEPATLTTAAPYNRGALVRLWGSMFGSRFLGLYNPGAGAVMTQTTPSPGFLNVCGIDFDAATNRVWWSYGEFYNGSQYLHPTLGYCTIDDGDFSVVAAGPWRLDPAVRGAPFERKLKGGSLKVPQWFANAHLAAFGAPYRATGFGGYYSILAAASAGPALFAAPESVYSEANRCQAGQTTAAAPKLSATPLVSFPWDTGAPKSARPGGYVAGTSDSPPPDDGIGVWQWTDWIQGGIAWIDDDAGTRGKHGVVVSSSFGYGGIGYKSVDTEAGTWGDGLTNDGGIALGLTVLDPADLAAVAAGGATTAPDVGPWWIPDNAAFDRRTLPYRGRHRAYDGLYSPVGAAFEPETSTLYLVQYGGVSISGESQPLVHKFGVAT